MERAPRTHWIGGWVGLRAVLDTVVKRRILSPRQESNPRSPIVQPIAVAIREKYIWGFCDWREEVKSVDNFILFKMYF
jgi:hypothetical protein